jgi:hypothetical protein
MIAMSGLELLAPAGAATAEELVEEVLEERIVGLRTRDHRRPPATRHLKRSEVDDRRPDPLRDVHERGL